MTRQPHTGDARHAQRAPSPHAPQSSHNAQDTERTQSVLPSQHTGEPRDVLGVDHSRQALPLRHTEDSRDGQDTDHAQQALPPRHTRSSQDAEWTQCVQPPRPEQLARHAPAITPALHTVNPGDSRYPLALERWRDWCEGDGLFSDATPLACLGDLTPLQRPTLGLLCSAHCPGSVLLETFRFVRAAAPESPTFIGGFHSPMERTCLDTLLVRHVPVIFCPGRRLHARSVPAAWRPAIADGRMLLLSPFSERQKRVDRGLARLRNAFVVALADSLFVPYARPGGSVLALVDAALRKGKGVITLDDPENAPLVRMGAERLEVGELIQRYCLIPLPGSA